MNMSDPKVSVIIPTFNRADLLPRALKSLQVQKFEDFEVVVVDDGSKDHTHEVVGDFGRTDRRIRYIWQPNRRLAEARNTGIDYSVGAYITFLDSDDEYLPDHLQLRLAYLQENPEVHMVHGGIEVVNGDWLVPDFYQPGSLIDLRECAVGPTFFMRRKVFDMVGRFVDRKFGEDTEFFARAQAGSTVHRMECRTYLYYRDTPDSIVRSEMLNPSL